VKLALAALAALMCREWFRRFKSSDFNVEDKKSAEKSKLVDDAELEALLDEDPCQEELAESLRVACVEYTVNSHYRYRGACGVTRELRQREKGLGPHLSRDRRPGRTSL